MRPLAAKSALLALYLPRQLGRRKATLALLVALVSAAAAAAMLHIWLYSQSIRFSIAGLLMMSDAGGYMQCANSLLTSGTFQGGAWCERRTLYPAFFAGLSELTGRVWLLTLLCQAIFVALCVFALARAVSRQLGVIAAVLTLLFSLGYLQRHAFPATMTENAGLIFGALGLALLVDGARRMQAATLAGGSALLSIALFSRAGPMFMLPALVGWACMAAPGPWRSRLKVAGLVAAGAAAGPVAHAIVAFMADAGLSNAQGNFSYTLYGLAVGRHWGAVFEDYPHILQLAGVDERAASREIYRLAFAAVATDPTLLVRAALRNLLLFLAQPMFERPGFVTGRLPTLCWWLGVAAVVAGRKDRLYSLVGWLSAGIVLSAPVILADGGDRSFAAGYPVIALQACMGILFAGALIARFAGWALPPLQPAEGTKRFEVAICIAAVGTLFVAANPVHRALVRSAAQPTAGACGHGLRSVVFRPGFESQVLAVVPGAPAQAALAMTISRERLATSVSATSVSAAALKKDIASFPVPVTLFRAWPLGGDHGTSDVAFFAAADYSGYRYQTLQACLDERETLMLADVPYAKAVSIRPVAGGR